jgi:CheY-like chemotaxis protein
MQKRLKDDESVRRFLDGALQGAERGVVLTQRLLAFSRKQELEAHAVSLPDLIGNLREMIVQSAGPLIKVAFDLDEQVPPAHIDPNQLELAILNLCVNARDAMGESGQLTITLREQETRGFESLAPGRYLVLSIADTGRGMDPETLRRAIEPFFTTKEVGKGTGLGLAMVHGFLLQSGGALMLKSEAGKGTQADLWIPVSSEALPAKNETDAVVTRTRPLKVLVVDDEVLLLMSTADTLKDMGHHPYEAMSGQEALGLLQEHSDMDLMITDHAMPKMTGIELALQARKLRPNLRIILASGYAQLPEDLTIELERLAKPYHEHDLIAVIEKLFAPAPAAG